MKERFAHVNGNIVPVGDAVVSIADRGLIYGDGLYETIRVRNGKCVRFRRHIERLFNGARVLGFNESVFELDFGKTIDEVLQANRLADARVRVTVTRGVSTDPGKMGGAGAGEPTVVVTADVLPEPGLEPTRVIISSLRRDEKSPLVGVKTLNCLPSVVALAEARDQGADDAVLLNTRGKIAEGTSANVFLLLGDRLVTPSLDQGCLAGTVRAAVLELAAELGFEAAEFVIEPDALREADELFFTSAIKLIRPICEVAGTRVGDGTHGTCARILEALLRAE